MIHTSSPTTNKHRIAVPSTTPRFVIRSVKPRLLSAALTTMVLLGMVAPENAQAHFFSEAHDCKAPVKPLEFVTELDRQEFDQKVEQYRSCLQSFVDKQNAGMGKHQSAANQAAETWNSYAERELGVTAPAQ
ncbi:MAG: hypothetical protein V7707_19915 [Motiliproteus sp.]